MYVQFYQLLMRTFGLIGEMLMHALLVLLSKAKQMTMQCIGMFEKVQFYQLLMNFIGQIGEMLMHALEIVYQKLR